MGNIKAHIALILVNIIYALSYGFSKDVMDGYVPPFAFIILRIGGATLLFWLLLAFTKHERIAKEDYKTLILCGLFGVAANQLMFFEGLKHTTSINASVIMVATPILVLILARVILKEHISWQKVTGIAIGMGGALSLLAAKMYGAKISPYGDVMILLNATSYGIYLVLVKPLMKKYKPLTVIRWAFTFGLIMALPFGLSQWDDINWMMNSAIVWKIVFIIIATTFFTYLLTMYGLDKVSPTVVSAYIYLQPILATTIALLLQKEELSFYTIIFGLMIFVGVFLVSVPMKKKIKGINTEH